MTRRVNISRSTPHPAFVRRVLIFRAALVLALGVALLFSGTEHPILGNLLATFWLAGAVLTLRWAHNNRGNVGSTFATIAGIVGIVAAVIGLARFLIEGAISLDATLALLGLTAVVIGVLRLFNAFRDGADGPAGSTRRIALGVGEIAIGVVWIAVDDVSRTVAAVAGTFALLGGMVMLLDALGVRSPESDDAVDEASREDRDDGSTQET